MYGFLILIAFGFIGWFACAIMHAEPMPVLRKWLIGWVSCWPGMWLPHDYNMMWGQPYPIKWVLPTIIACVIVAIYNKRTRDVLR